MPITPLFDEEAPIPLLKEPVEPRPLFNPEPGESTRSAQGESTWATPLFQGDLPVPQVRIDPITLPPPTPPRLPPLNRPSVPEAGPAFVNELDPLAEKTWRDMCGRFPNAPVSQQTHWRSKLQGLFPLSAQSLQTLGRRATERMPTVMGEVAKIGELLARVEPAKTLGRIGADAQAAQLSAGKKSLFSRMELVIRHFDPQQADQELVGLAIALNGLQKRIQPVRDLLLAVDETLHEDLPLIEALVDLSRSSALAASVIRRQEMLLASAQQLQMAQQQLQNLENQIAASTQSLEELRTVTLPALGFVQSL